ncbi:glycoside hydrolase 5 family protein [Ferrimonas aestuarii]|uniref:Glycoside hydrolase family 5 domain-containing protein n=1 Tax=Ferrimonas aestuarii TaxID=2569539 RepID=A0A4U1BN04_9GAMM|nr:hypothetical protein [Ferrimonas aestuarii]TKB52814.1 hypothetical protein FCL42_16020 [Ferrimonas aestuarii]
MSDHRTQWRCSVTVTSAGPVAALTCISNQSAQTQFRIKGICYSPCPIGASNKEGANCGDWFWDTYQAGAATITSWEQTWRSDLKKIKALGVNTIRVYSMLSKQLPTEYNADTVYTHQAFLDACFELELFVLVGFPLPPTLFDYGQSPQLGASWWEDNLTQTLTALGQHPAVMGFVIANEVDNNTVDTYSRDAEKKQYWWRQIESMAAKAKAAAPDKLVGIANHDDPKIPRLCETEMAACPSVDFWGVNSYQPQSFSSVFGGSNNAKGYATLVGKALKPVILTEYGFPSTSRTTANTLVPVEIMSTQETQTRVAKVLDSMLPQAYAEQLNLGVCYFEFCDEWWDQSEYNIVKNQSCPKAKGPNKPDGGAGATGLVPPNNYTWFGGPIACGFPNYYWDNDGFGLYSVAVGHNRTPSQPWNFEKNEPALPLDERAARTPVIKAVTEFNSMCLISGFVSEITQLDNNLVQVAISSNEYGRIPISAKAGTLTNYLYAPSELDDKQEQLLQQAKSSGVGVTVAFTSRQGSRHLSAVVVQ